MILHNTTIKGWTQNALKRQEGAVIEFFLENSTDVRQICQN